MSVAMAGELRARRIQEGWTQLDLVARSGVSHRTIRQIEKGEGNPSELTLARLERAFQQQEPVRSSPPGGALCTAEAGLRVAG